MKNSDLFNCRKTGKCFICGLSTELNIHANCSRKGQKQKKHEFEEKECDSLDCKKMYAPASYNQKLCSECIELRKQARFKVRGY